MIEYLSRIEFLLFIFLHWKPLLFIPRNGDFVALHITICDAYLKWLYWLFLLLNRIYSLPLILFFIALFNCLPQEIKRREDAVAKGKLWGHNLQLNIFLWTCFAVFLNCLFIYFISAAVPNDNRNWPPFFPIIHHDIANEIPVHAQRLQYLAFASWLGMRDHIYIYITLYIILLV